MQGTIFRFTLAAVVVIGSHVSAHAQPHTLQVRIVQREESKKELTAVIPALPEASDGDKSGAEKDSADKSAKDKSGLASKLPAQTHSLTVNGATLTLRLPDGRGVRVSCESKYALRLDYINRRSCRVPPIDDVTAEFDGDQAKLIWSVSIDGLWGTLRKATRVGTTLLCAPVSPRWSIGASSTPS